MTDVNDVINAFNTYRNWFYTLNPTLQIIVAILTIAVTILMIYAVFSLAIALVKAGFWLYAMAFKGMVVGIAVGIYTGVVLCIKIPIAAIKEEPLNYTFDEYKANVVDFATAVFPPKKTESSEDQKIPVCSRSFRTSFRTCGTSLGTRTRTFCQGTSTNGTLIRAKD